MTVAEQSAEGNTQTAIYTRALIIGTGFSGLGMGIALKKQGVDFLILEKADDVGGTWRDNTYPGAACDVPSHLYSFSFALKSDWPHVFSYQPDILTYLKGVADKYGLKRHIRFGQHVDRAHWDDSEFRWHVFTKSGEEYVAQFLISGAGALHIPSLPDVAGLGDFHGPVFHTAQWDHTVDLTGKRVAVIGTGASAIQVVPELVKIASQVQLYQRTPAWIKPRINFAFPDSMKRAFKFVPGLRAALRTATYWALDARAFAFTKHPSLLRFVEPVYELNMRRYVADPQLRRKLTPSYRAGCKRILISDNFYQAVADPKTDVITDGIARVIRDGIVTVDGTERKVDVIVCATGFHVTDWYNYLDIKGAHGEDLGDRWNREGVMAHRGITVADVPNLFLLVGPNTGLAHNSMVFMIESQIGYVADAIGAADRLGAQALAPTRHAQDQFNEELQRDLSGTVWNTGGCQSWYMDDHGVNRSLWSGFTWEYWLATRKFKMSEYSFSGVGQPVAV
ncbi:MAG TPA: NAD(P)/FAD-dependent oxidoreductase [Mycobacterium sp.]|nr:NAD(P)/FAD-dependent oxidoreductase [Mycobacterium sp.]